MTYLYTFPPTWWKEPWWHDCEGIGKRVSVWRNGELPLRQPEMRLCPFCELRGQVRTHTNSFMTPMFFDGAAWMLPGPHADMALQW
jgi:hypothetical protein